MLMMQKGFVEGDIEISDDLNQPKSIVQGGCARAGFDVCSQLAFVKDYT